MTLTATGVYGCYYDTWEKRSVTANERFYHYYTLEKFAEGNPPRGKGSAGSGGLFQQIGPVHEPEPAAVDSGPSAPSPG